MDRPLSSLVPRKRKLKEYPDSAPPPKRLCTKSIVPIVPCKRQFHPNKWDPDTRPLHKRIRTNSILQRDDLGMTEAQVRSILKPHDILIFSGFLSRDQAINNQNDDVAQVDVGIRKAVQPTDVHNELEPRTVCQEPLRKHMNSQFRGQTIGTRDHDHVPEVGQPTALVQGHPTELRQGHQEPEQEMEEYQEHKQQTEVSCKFLLPHSEAQW